MTLIDQVRDLLTDALRAAQAYGRLPDVQVDEVTVERPQNPEHGDFATSTPMKLARVMRRNPFDIAEAIASSTATGGILESAGGRASRVCEPQAQSRMARGAGRRDPAG